MFSPNLAFPPEHGDMKGADPLLCLHRLCPALHGASCAHVRTPQLTDPGSIHTLLLIAALCSPLGSRLKMIWTRSLVVMDQKVVQKGKLRLGEGRPPLICYVGMGRAGGGPERDAQQHGAQDKGSFTWV